MRHPSSAICSGLCVAYVLTRESFREQVIGWGQQYLRPHFWRTDDLDAFSMLVVEVLLVRTRAEAVASVAKTLLTRFPTPTALLSADPHELQGLLKPLGLFRKRSEGLLSLSAKLLEQHGGQVPEDEVSLLSLPYVGRYTANAVLCFCFGARRPIVDANVARLFSRCFAAPMPRGKLDMNHAMWDLAGVLLPKTDVKTYNWSLIDLGRAVCTPGTPICGDCPLGSGCKKHDVALTQH